MSAFTSSDVSRCPEWPNLETPCMHEDHGIHLHLMICFYLLSSVPMCAALYFWRLREPIAQTTPRNRYPARPHPAPWPEPQRAAGGRGAREDGQKGLGEERGLKVTSGRRWQQAYFHYMAPIAEFNEILEISIALTKWSNSSPISTGQRLTAYLHHFSHTSYVPSERLENFF